MHQSLLFFPALFILASAQCPEPTTTVAIEWPDDLYARREIMVSVVASNGAITTYEGVDCPGNPHGMTIAAGPQTFSFNRLGSSQEGHILIDECVPLGSSMECTIIQQGPLDTTSTIVYSDDEIYTVSMAVVESGAENTVLPTVTGPPYLGCPEEWQQCGDEPWCCPTTATICTTAPNSHEACASVHNEEFPGPAIPYYSTMGPPPGSGGSHEESEPTGSEDGAGPFAAQPTHLLVGGLAGLGLALL
ncbi:hypothetical protein BJX63DRAFT_427840 [Aspergillus granulosus]|uniref:Uncharacterized protein n=1 Tax=Aspergillus granulosus TaxID=176169 RepID=A0ABR4I088_9EURO